MSDEENPAVTRYLAHQARRDALEARADARMSILLAFLSIGLAIASLIASVMH